MAALHSKGEENMTWIGRKKIAFIPVYRPNVPPPDPPDSIPADWKSDILRRVVFDPDSLTVADRSLRAYIRAASSGQADLDAVVMPMVVIDRKDIRLEHPDVQQLGAAMRAQGFDAAALVMLGLPGAGTSELGGFLARFVMKEPVGVWAMELMHVLTGFDDIRCRPALVDCQNNPTADIGFFDEMAYSGGQHPTAYTKRSINWLDATAVTQHIGLKKEYDLHAVGLPQPPPTGRTTAVQIGTQVPYMMVEARMMVDQFESKSQPELGIPSTGVIVYRVQTTSPHGSPQDSRIPVFLLTPTALAPGASFTAENGVTVQVISALPGGYRIRLEDPSQHVVDRSAEYGTPPAAGPPTACVVPGLSSHNIAYRDTAWQLHELWRDAQGATGTTNLTANAGAPKATGTPFAYVDTTRNTVILLYRGEDGTVRSLYWSTGPVGHDDLGGFAHAPKAVGNPVGYYVQPTDEHHVVYRTGDGNLNELNWTGVAPVSYGGNLTAAISAPRAAGDPTAFVDAAGVNLVVYRSVDGHIFGLYWTNGPSGLDNLSGFAGTPQAAGDPVAYYTPHNDMHQVVYRAADGHIYELYWPGIAPVSGWDLTVPAGAPAATGNLAAYYSAGTNTKHVFYRSADGRLHEIWWVPGTPPSHVDLSVYGTPKAADRPAAFTVEGPNTQHVTYRGTDNHIYEVTW